MRRVWSVIGIAKEDAVVNDNWSKIGLSYGAKCDCNRRRSAMWSCCCCFISRLSLGHKWATVVLYHTYVMNPPAYVNVALLSFIPIICFSSISCQNWFGCGNAIFAFLMWQRSVFLMWIKKTSHQLMSAAEIAIHPPSMGSSTFGLTCGIRSRWSLKVITLLLTRLLFC